MDTLKQNINIEDYTKYMTDLDKDCLWILKDRWCITEETAKENGLRMYIKGGQYKYIAIPIYDINNNLINYELRNPRDYFNNKKRFIGFKKGVLNINNLNQDKWTIIVDSNLCCLLVMQIIKKYKLDNLNCIAVNYDWGKNHLLATNINDYKFIFALDRDADNQKRVSEYTDNLIKNYFSIYDYIRNNNIDVEFGRNVNLRGLYYQEEDSINFEEENSEVVGLLKDLNGNATDYYNYQLEDKETKQGEAKEQYINLNTFDLGGYEQFLNKSKDVLRTTIRDLNDVLGGGFLNGLVTIDGKSAEAKTIFLLNLVYDVARKKPVLVYSFKMKEYMLYTKLISHLAFGMCGSEVTVSNILKNDKIKNINTHEYCGYKVALKQLQESKKNIIIKETAEKISVDDIARDINQYKELFGVTPVVMIDYLQALGGNHKSNKQDNQKAITNYNMLKLRELAHTHNTNIIVTSSSNKRELDDIKYNSDYLLVLKCDMDPRQKLDITANIPYIIKVVKNRFGDKGYAYCNLNKAYNSFRVK